MINLHDDMLAYNKTYNTDFISIIEFCQHVYDQYGSVFRVGEALFISPSAIHVHFKAMGVKMLPKGVRSSSKKLGILLKLETENMTLKEIARVTGYALIYCRNQLRKYKLPYKKIVEKAGTYNRVNYKGKPILPFVFGRGWKENKCKKDSMN